MSECKGAYSVVHVHLLLLFLQLVLQGGVHVGFAKAVFQQLPAGPQGPLVQHLQGHLSLQVGVLHPEQMLPAILTS